LEFSTKLDLEDELPPQKLERLNVLAANKVSSDNAEEHPSQPDFGQESPPKSNAEF
jgi:hypothetical protein